MSKQVLLGLLATLFFASCDRATESAVTGFVANNADQNLNHVVAFLGDSDGIPGTLRDIPNLYNVLSNGFNFTFHGPGGAVAGGANASSVGFKHASSTLVVQKTAQVAKAMLETDKAAW